MGADLGLSYFALLALNVNVYRRDATGNREGASDRLIPSTSRRLLQPQPLNPEPQMDADLSLGDFSLLALNMHVLNPEPYTLHPAPCTLHPAPCTLHPEPCTLNSAP